MISTSPIVDKYIVTTASSKGRKIDLDQMEAQISMPPKPKKPFSPWIAFVRENKKDLMDANPGAGIQKLTPDLSKLWMSTDRSKYLEDYESRKTEYQAQIEGFNNSLTEEQQAFLKLRAGLIREHNALGQLKRAYPIPKRPRSAANLYTSKRVQDSDMKARKASGEKMSELFSIILKEYTEMSSKAKQQYFNLQENDKERFRYEINQWFAKVNGDENLRKSIKQQAKDLYDRFKELYNL